MAHERSRVHRAGAGDCKATGRPAIGAAATQVPGRGRRRPPFQLLGGLKIAIRIADGPLSSVDGMTIRKYAPKEVHGSPATSGLPIPSATPTRRIPAPSRNRRRRPKPRSRFPASKQHRNQNNKGSGSDHGGGIGGNNFVRSSTAPIRTHHGHPGGGCVARGRAVGPGRADVN